MEEVQSEEIGQSTDQVAEPTVKRADITGDVIDVPMPPPNEPSRVMVKAAPPVLPAINTGDKGLMLRTMSDLVSFAKVVYESKCFPETLNSPQAIMIAIQTGAELGLTPMKSLASIYVVNGKPSLYGDAPMTLVMGSGIFDHNAYTETEVGTYPKDDYGFTITVARKGGKPVTRTFTVAKAKVAGVWGKKGPWSQYPDRMLKTRALSFALRDAFPDVLSGIPIKEEIIDHEVEPKESKAVSVVSQSVDRSINRAGALPAAK